MKLVHCKYLTIRITYRNATDQLLVLSSMSFKSLNLMAKECKIRSKSKWHMQNGMALLKGFKYVSVLKAAIYSYSVFFSLRNNTKRMINILNVIFLFYLSIIYSCNSHTCNAMMCTYEDLFVSSRAKRRKKNSLFNLQSFLKSFLAVSMLEKWTLIRLFLSNNERWMSCSVLIENHDLYFVCNQ